MDSVLFGLLFWHCLLGFYFYYYFSDIILVTYMYICDLSCKGISFEVVFDDLTKYKKKITVKDKRW